MANLVTPANRAFESDDVGGALVETGCRSLSSAEDEFHCEAASIQLKVFNSDHVSMILDSSPRELPAPAQPTPRLTALDQPPGACVDNVERLDTDKSADKSEREPMLSAMHIETLTALEALLPLQNQQAEVFREKSDTHREPTPLSDDSSQLTRPQKETFPESARWRKADKWKVAMARSKEQTVPQSIPLLDEPTQPLLFHPALFDGRDPLSEVLEWLGRTDNVNTDQLFRADDMSRLTWHEGETTNLSDLPIVDDDTTSLRAQKPREWPPKQDQQQSIVGLVRSDWSKVSPCGGTKKTDNRGNLDRQDEEEWLVRKQRTGTVGRVVIYAANENPQDDVVLRGGAGRPVTVTSVQEFGPASRAGVKAGDRLASINGKKHFSGLTADAVRAQLFHPPVIVVFLGFVGKLQAEVRLTSGHQLCGLPMRRDILPGLEHIPIDLCDHYVFNATASLFLSVKDADDGTASVSPESLFELQRPEASELVRRALKSACKAAAANGFHVASCSGCLVEQMPLNYQGQEMPTKPGGDVGFVDDGLGVESDGCDPRDPLDRESDREPKRLEASPISAPSHRKVPNLFFPATDGRNIGAGLTPRRLSMSPRGGRPQNGSRKFSRSLLGPRPPRLLGPCVDDPDICRMNYRVCD